MGVTHHSNYVRIMEEARIDALEKIGYSFAVLGKEGIVSPVVSLNCRYLQPTSFDDTVEVVVNVKDISRFKLTLSYVMSVRGVKVFTAESVHCFMQEGNPLDISERFPRLSEYLPAENENTGCR